MIIENTALSAGIVLLAGIIGGKIANYFKLPSVTGYLIAGLLVGPSVLDLFSGRVLDNLEPINSMALGLIAIMIGGELTKDRIKMISKKLPPIFLAETFLTFFLVSATAYFISNSIPLALVLGVLSLATAPAAIVSILKEYRARGEFPQLLMSLVALDNLLCIIGFGLLTSFLNVLFYQNTGGEQHLVMALFGEIGLSVLLGLGIGIILVYTNKMQFSEDKHLVINLGSILFGVGVAEVLGLPSLLIAMLMGIMVTNFSSQRKRFFKLFQKIEIPILIAFLTLAGVKLNLFILGDVGLLAIGYILARLFGKIMGARLGSIFSKDLSSAYRKNMGLALTPQAGVAIGLAILAEDKLPVQDGVIITIILSTVIFFELVGPILVKKSLQNCKSLENCPDSEPNEAHPGENA